MAIDVLLATALAMMLAAGSSQRLLIQHDIPYRDTEDVRQTLDVYAPEGAQDAPLLVFVHGGGLLFGDKSLVAHVGQRLAAAGIVTVAPNHRFSPAVTHPAHVEDVAAAVAWAVDHAREIGADPDRVVLAGHSSGGYLVALLATDPRWLEAAGVARDAIRAVAPISGFFHVPRLAPERPQTVWGGEPAHWSDASPAAHVDAEVPPMLLLFADGDDDARKAENTDFAAALRAAGAPAPRLIEVRRRDHRTIFYTLNTPGDPSMTALIEFVTTQTCPSGTCPSGTCPSGTGC